MKKIKNKIAAYRVHEYIRLFDFHKPLISQMPVIMFICATFVMVSMTIVMVFSGTTH